MYVRFVNSLKQVAGFCEYVASELYLNGPLISNLGNNLLY